MYINKIKSISMIIFTLFLITGCKDSTGTTTPESATISGTITFTGTWPTDGTVAVSLSKNWPPQGVPAASLTITSSDTYSYTFDNVNFGTYKAIAVSWGNPDTTYNSSCNQSILGAYGGTITDYFMNLDSLTTSTTNYELTGYDFDVNLGYAISNPYNICQPPCVTLTDQSSCESQGHCKWEVSCMTK